MEDLIKVEEELSRLLDSLEYELYSFKYMPRVKTLEVIVDRIEPINLDDITFVSTKISEFLDEHDFTEDSYTLDVSSLGIEKPIKISRIDDYVGKYINVHLKNPINGLNTYEGDFVEFDNEQIVIAYKVKTRTVKVAILKEEIDKARLAIKF